jgi:hypothetical protein
MWFSLATGEHGAIVSEHTDVKYGALAIAMACHDASLAVRV